MRLLLVWDIRTQDQSLVLVWVCVCVCVSVPNTLLFATYLTLIRSEITYVFILYKPMPISIGENVMHVILSSLA